MCARVYVDAGNTIFMLMPRASGSVFKLCKSNINAKPVINNLSASRGVTRGLGEETGGIRDAPKCEKEGWSLK